MATNYRIPYKGSIGMVMVKEIIFFGHEEITSIGTSPIRVMIYKEPLKVTNLVVVFLCAMG